MNNVFWQPGLTLDNLEEQVIKKAMRIYNNNKTRVAQSLGIAIRTLDNKLEKYLAQDQQRSPQFEPTTNQPDEFVPGAFASVALKEEHRPLVQPAPKAPKKHALPVRESKEVQAVSPKPDAKADPKRQGKALQPANANAQETAVHNGKKEG